MPPPITRQSTDLVALSDVIGELVMGCRGGANAEAVVSATRRTTR